MEKWINYSSNPLERERIVSTRHSGEIGCLNCGRILTSEFVLCNKEAGCHTCPCGFVNHLDLIGEYEWKQYLSKE